MRATTIQTTTTTQFTTGGANTSSSRNQIQKITNAGTKVDNLHRGKNINEEEKCSQSPFTRVVVSSSSSNDHDVLGLRGGQTKRRGVGVVARMTSAADTSSSSSCTISQELANLEQEFRDMLDPDSDSETESSGRESDAIENQRVEKRSCERKRREYHSIASEDESAGCERNAFRKSWNV